MEADSKSPSLALMERARMLVNVSESLGLPLSGPSDPELEAAIKAVKVEQLCKGDELLFELRSPDGKAWKLYLDGRTEGFPDGALLLNHALPLVNALIGEVLCPIKQTAPGKQS